MRGEARQHPFDVAIEDRRTNAHAQAGNRACGGQADAGQQDEFFDIAGKLAAMIGDDDFCRLLQVASASVVTQPGPQVQHFVLGRVGQRLHARQGLHETVEVAQNGADLGLLQHDFRYPDPVRRDVLLPGQVMSAMTVVPVQHGAGELFGLHGLEGSRRDVSRDMKWSAARALLSSSRCPSV